MARGLGGVGEEAAVCSSSPPAASRDTRRGKCPGQGQGKTRFLSCSPQFLRASLEPIEDKAWTVGLSQELSQQLGSSAPSSWEKVCLLPRAGAGLAPVLCPHRQFFHCSPFTCPQKALPPQVVPVSGYSLAPRLALHAPRGRRVCLGPALS